jgi:hypothetical protein
MCFFQNVRGVPRTTGPIFSAVFLVTSACLWRDAFSLQVCLVRFWARTSAQPEVRIRSCISELACQPVLSSVRFACSISGSVPERVMDARVLCPCSFCG